MADPTVLDERYELVRKIGSGGMGTVWRARDRLLDRDVAVKVLNEGFGSDPNFTERFRREARSAASLQHPNIVTVYDTGTHDGVPFIVMELVDGESVHALLHQGRLDVDRTTRIARSVLDALAHAHERGLVHRDMKPANVLIESKTGEVKVADFGIAKGAEESTGGLTRTGTLIGTAAYLSPEQARGLPATAASDLYAVGCLIYACLTGKPPFAADTAVAVAMQHLNDPVPSLREQRPDTPPGLEAAVMRALEKEPSRRFASAAQMRGAIDGTVPIEPLPTQLSPAVQATRPMTSPIPTAPPSPATERLRVDERPRSSRAARVLAALTALLIAAAAVWLVLLYVNNRGTNNPNDSVTPPSGLPSAGAPAAVATPTPTASPTVAPTSSGPEIDLPGIHFGGAEPTPAPTPTP